MNEEEIRNLKAGVEAMRGAADECNTIVYYLERLIATYDTSPPDAELAKLQYYEIVKDELNHALRFIFTIFVPLTGIEPETEGLEEVFE